jgi:hypothetical protein
LQNEIKSKERDHMAEDCTAQDSISQLRLDISIPHSPVKKLDPEVKGREVTLFRRQLNAQLVLLLPDVKSLLPHDHLVFFLVNTIKEPDLSGMGPRGSHDIRRIVVELQPRPTSIPFNWWMTNTTADVK